MSQRFIGQFMWGFQDSFRISLELSSKNAMHELGLKVDPGVYLIGVRNAPGPQHDICIEPESGPLIQADFDNLRAAAANRFARDPERRIFYSSRYHQEQRVRRLRNSAFIREIRQIVEERLGLHVAVGAPVPVGSYDVYTVLTFGDAEWTASPRLPTSLARARDRIGITDSLFSGCVDSLLAAASRELQQPDPGSSLLLSLHERVSQDAAQALMGSITYVATGMPGDLYRSLNEVAVLRYEKRGTTGRMLVTQPSNTYLRWGIRLSNPVPLRDTRTLRKMLELTRVDGAGLVVDHEVAYGLATVPRRVRRLKETIFEILLTGPGSWLLRHDGIGLMDVTYGSPKVPSRRMTRSTFDMIAQRVFRDHPLNSDLLWSMAVGVADAEHGTMLVVSRSAADEAERLGAQALRVDPSRLDMASLKSATAVDGAILLDPLGNTHAIGVILDGQAGTGGSPARGARYNSAVRYLNAHSDAMVVLVSEDGMINLLPEVMPQVSRASVQEVIGNLEAAVRQPTERRKFGKVLETVRRYKFYLSQDQCDRINELVEIDTADRMRDGMPVFIGPSFAPDSAMDESYFDD